MFAKSQKPILASWSLSKRETNSLASRALQLRPRFSIAVSISLCVSF